MIFSSRLENYFSHENKHFNINMSYYENKNNNISTDYFNRNSGCSLFIRNIFDINVLIFRFYNLFLY